jgi:galactose mutarotase-like enzyme
LLVLRSERLLVRMDPTHGAEVLDLVELRSGRQLLGRPPFGSEPPAPGDLDEDPWTAAWRGGWQGCLPNAGSACEVGQTRHGFHGRASNDPWEVIEAGADACRVRWTGHGLAAERRLELSEALSITTEVRAVDDSAPLVALEHLSLGLELIEPSVELELPAAPASELDDSLGPAEPPEGAPEWPEIMLVGGETERGERWNLEDDRARVYLVRDVPAGRAAARNPARGHGVAITWTAEVLPHLLVWHEARGSGGVWRNATEMLCLEPCSVPHLLGLGAALARGQARRLERGETMSWSMAVRPV